MTKKNWLGIFLIIMLFGMAEIACSQSRYGTVIITGIPDVYNGKWAFFAGWNDDVDIFGAQSFSQQNATLVQISNGSVVLPMWIEQQDGSYIRYSGDHTVLGYFEIHDGQTVDFSGYINLFIIRFNRITFSNGNATIAWAFLNQ